MVSRGKKISLFAKKCIWVSNPVHGALGVTSVPPGQLGPLDFLCFQMIILVHKREGALVGRRS